MESFYKIQCIERTLNYPIYSIIDENTAAIILNWESISFLIIEM